MHPSGFREGVDFASEGTHPRLVDEASRRAFELTPIEAKLVLLYAGEKDPRLLAQNARAQGVAVEPAQVAVFLDRLVHAGFLPKPAAGAPAKSRAPLMPNDPLPMFREDLAIAPAASGLVQVTDPRSGRSFTLYDFEASVGRMLDGRRTAEEVIDIASRLGIPVDLASLDGFIRQMGAYGFLAPPGTSSTGARRPRRPWTPEVRELYQAALRHFRTGKPEQALDYLAALLQVDPQNAEAQQLKERIGGEPAVEIDFSDMHGEALTSEAPVEVDLYADAQPVEPGQVVEDRPAEATPTEEDRPPPLNAFDGWGEPSAVVRPSRRKWVLAAGGLAALGLLFPVPTQLAVPCELAPVAVASVTAPRAGEIRSWPVAGGTVVKAGQTLATFSTTELEKQLERASRLGPLRAKLVWLHAKAKAAGAIGRKRARAKRALEAAMAARDRLGEPGNSARKRKLAAKAARRVAAAERTFRAADRSYQARTHEAEIAEVQGQLEKAEADVQALQAQIAGAVIAAPATGLFVAGGGKPATVEAGEAIGRIVQPGLLQLTALAVSGNDLAAARLKLPAGEKGELQGLAWADRKAGRLEAKVVGADPVRAGQATLVLQGGLRPLLWKLVRWLPAGPRSGT